MVKTITDRLNLKEMNEELNLLKTVSPVLDKNQRKTFVRVATIAHEAGRRGEDVRPHTDYFKNLLEIAKSLNNIEVK